MKYTDCVKLGLLVALVLVAGCARPTSPEQAGEKPKTETVATSTPASTTVAQLSQEWTVLNFGAPW